MKSSGRRSQSNYGLPTDAAQGSKRRRKSSVPFWERALRAIGGRFLLVLVQRSIAAGKSLVHSDWIMMVPITALLMITSTDFLVLTTLDGSADNLFFAELGNRIVETNRDAAEALKANILRLLYLFVIALAALHWRAIKRYFTEQPHLIILILWLFFTAVYSIDPGKVITNTIIVIVGMTASILFATAHAPQRRYTSLYMVVFLPMLVLHLASLAIFIMYGSGFVEFLTGGLRYGGLAGNPNSLGATGVLGYWSAACLVLSINTGRTTRLLAAAAIVMFLLHIIMSGSGTALITVVLVTGTLSWLRILSAFKIRIRRVMNISVMILFVLLLVLVGVASSPTEVYLTFTESLGKDASLTGRTELWAIAREAIAVHPIFGWGYDSHISVFDTGIYQVPYNHYHNGFMDTIIAGGVVLLGLVLFNIYRYSSAFFLAFQRDAQAFPMVLPLILLLFLNLSEYSLLRPNAQIWTIYILSYIMLTYQAKGYSPARAASAGKGRKASQRRGSRRGLRWA